MPSQVDMTMSVSSCISLKSPCSRGRVKSNWSAFMRARDNISADRSRPVTIKPLCSSPRATVPVPQPASTILTPVLRILPAKTEIKSSQR